MSYLPAEDISARLTQIIVESIGVAGGWVGFDTFMAQALYTPGLGYYAHDSAKFGKLPFVVVAGEQLAGSDFVTAPEMTPLFGQTLAAQVAQALQMTHTNQIWEFGAGSGALALQVLDALAAQGQQVQRYCIVDLSGSLRVRQRETLARFAHVVEWVSELPETLQGVVLGNEVLDAMPVKLLARVKGVWYERGVVEALGSALGKSVPERDNAFMWQDRPTDLRPPLEIDGEHDYLTEIHPQGEAFIRTLGERMARGAAFFIDYGFGESEYFHPQRHMGTLVCHRLHKVDDDPLADVGLKDITAHVNFTGTAVAAQEAGFEVLGYTSQAHFLINCGLGPKLDALAQGPRAMATKLMMEHEMGELFKVIGLAKGVEPWDAMGFVRGDRTHRL